jgi:hypothetical protein
VAPTPTSFAEIVSDDFPIFHATIMRVYDLAANLIRNARARGTIRRFMNVIREIRILVALSGGNRFVRPLLTASSVIAVMPVSMQMVPNPGCRNEWPVHCDGGIHYVRPFNFGAWLAVVMDFAIAPHIPRKKKKPAEQHH